ncbi:MAG TPA: translocation/assembly module TamB domain-containing protein, partial [Candidatus Manganitrophaceae bacterium]|nr:translocation/assembly module TamB domain-containing protein [Candidatus Manganitrophaceae bacterium]
AGKITLQGHAAGPVQNVAFNGKVAVLNLLVDGIETGSLRADLSYEGGRVALAALAGELFSGSFTGEAEGSLPLPASRAESDPQKPPRYRLALRYKQIPLEKVKKIIGGSGAASSGNPIVFEGIFLDGDLSLSGEGSVGEGWEAGGHLTAKRHPLFSTPAEEEPDRLNRLIALFEGGELDWKGSERRWTVGPATLSFPETTAALQGEWTPEGGWRLDTQVQSGEMKKMAEALRLPVTGRMNLQGRLSGRGPLPSFQGEIALDRWTLLSQPFGAFFTAFETKGREILFNQGSLGAPPVENRDSNGRLPYRFKGSLSLADPAAPSFNFQVEAAGADPQEFLTLFKQSIPLQTRATGRLAIEGTPKAFSVHGPLVLAKGSLYGERFDRGKVELTVTEKEVLLKKAALDQDKSRVEGEGEIGYSGTYALTLKANRLRIDETRFFRSALPLLSGDVGVEVYGKGTFKKPALKVIAAVQNLQYGGMEGVRGTVKVNWVDQSVKVEGTFPQKNFFLSGEIVLASGYPFSFQSRFDRLQIDPLLKGRLSGPLSNMRLLASGEMKGAGKMSRIEQTSLTGSFSEMQADFSGYTIQNDGPVSLSATEGAFKFESARFKGENTSLEFNGGLALLKEWDLFVTGEADLNLIKFFTKEIASGKGKAHLDLRVSDRWEQPQIRGALTLENGTIRTETLSQAVHISSLAVAFNERQLVLETFEGEMGRGRFRGNGKADLAGFGIGAFSFLLTLDEARVHLLPDLSATLDGELLFQRKGKSQTLQGELTMKKAVYEKRIDLKSLVANSAKVRETSLSSETPVIGQTALNIHLYGKEEILINNNIAKIPLEVDLFIKGSFDQPLLIGRVDLPEGHVYFRRNDFQIVAGSVEFLNPSRIDPTLNIRAKTEVQNLPPNNVRYAIDVALTGTLSRFTLTLTSFPSLPEADILSLLTVGKTTAEVALSQKGGGGSEAASFVVSEVLEGSIQKFTGVDRIQVDPYTNGSGAKSSSGTRLTAEKSLLDGRLLVIYTTSTDPSEEDLIRMIYELNKNVSLVGKRDEKGQIGGDLRFRFEFR